MDTKLIFGIIGAVICVIYPTLVNSHGYMLEPPNRSSLWRFEEFHQYNVTENFEDNQLFCGGVAVQFGHNNGQCGECGDPFNQTRPRDNENGGVFGKGIIVRQYQPGQIIDIFVQLTAVHLGHFEFGLCPLSSPIDQEKESCFQKNKLRFVDGTFEHLIVDQEIMDYNMQVQLPAEFRCEHCVMQWHYLTGNSWGLCPNGTESMGCGEQETFRGCADIAIR